MARGPLPTAGTCNSGYGRVRMPLTMVVTFWRESLISSLVIPGTSRKMVYTCGHRQAQEKIQVSVATKDGLDKLVW